MHRKLLTLIVVISMVAIITPFLIDDTSKGDSTSPEASISGVYYDTLEEALAASNNGDVVRVLTNCTIDTNTSVPAGVTLLIPYSETDTDGHDLGVQIYDDSVTSRKIVNDSYLYLTVTVSSGTNVDVQGTLIIGGITGRFFTFDYQGHTSDDFSRLILNGTITVQNGGTVQCYGFIKGSGNLNALSGSNVYEPFVITDFVGGDNAYNLYKSGQSPFNRYSFMNIQCMMVINGGSSLYGYANLYADSKYNETTVCIIGNSSALLILNSNSSATLTYDNQKYVKAEWESNIWNDIGRTTISVSGGATFGSMILSASGNSIDTKDCIFSFPYNIALILNDGTYDVTYQYRILPGSTITVSSNATLNVNGQLYIYDGLTDRVYRDKYYPTTSQLEGYSFDTCGRLIIDGTLNITSGSTLAGTIESKNIGATIIVDSNANVGECTVKYGCDYKASGVSSTTLSETTRILSATTMNESGIKTSLIVGKTYVCENIGTSSNTSYTYTNTSTGSSSTVTVNQTLSGKWRNVTDNPTSTHTVTYNVNGGSISAPTQSPVVEGSTFTISYYAGVKTNYMFGGWSDGTKTYSAGSTYTMGTNNVILTAVWVPTSTTMHSVTYKVNGGSESAPTQSPVIEGVTFTVASYSGTKTGYAFGGWSDGASTYQAGSTYTMGTSNVTLTAVWNAETTYTMTSTAGEGGSISPVGTTTVSEGSDLIYVILASDNYKVYEVTIDGVSIGAVNKYIFSSITANHTVSVTFEASPGTETWIDPSTGYIYEETETTVGGTDISIIRATSPSNEVTITATFTNEELGITTTSTSSSSGDTLEVTVDLTATQSGTFDEVSISAAQAEEILEQIAAAVLATGAEDPTITIDITGSGSSDVTSTSLYMSQELLEAIGDSEIPVTVETDTGTMEFDADVMKTLASYGEDLVLEIGTVDKSQLNEEQREKVGDNTIISAEAMAGTTVIHDLGGNVKVTMPYTLKSTDDPDKVEIWYLDDNGNITEMEATYDAATKTVSFYTDHFSYFVIAFDHPSDEPTSNNWLIYVAVIIVAIIVIAVAAYYVKTKKTA